MKFFIPSSSPSYSWNGRDVMPMKKAAIAAVAGAA